MTEQMNKWENIFALKFKFQKLSWHCVYDRAWPEREWERGVRERQWKWGKTFATASVCVCVFSAAYLKLNICTPWAFQITKIYFTFAHTNKHPYPIPKYHMSNWVFHSLYVCVCVPCCHLHALDAFVLFALLKAILSGLFSCMLSAHKFLVIFNLTSWLERGAGWPLGRGLAKGLL